jgi:hypothetical protein
VVLTALFVGFAFAVFSMLNTHDTSRSWSQPPILPLQVEAIVPSRADVQRVPQGAALSPNGLLTILRVPPTPAQPAPIVEGRQLPAAVPAGTDVDPAIAGGLRGFFRTRPQPSDERLITTTLEYRYTQLRLVLVEGCFRADGPSGPLVVFPPGARLFLDGPYLSVGVPGGPGTKARVGEELYWEAYAAQITEQGSLKRFIHSADPARCCRWL